MTTACKSVNGSTGPHRSIRGFSLIELMVALVIAAIIMGVALPAYTGYMQKTRRTDAKVTLTSMASQQERYYLKNNGYTTNIAAIGAAVSQEGYYDITVTNAPCGNSGCYTLTATPRSGEAQAGDTDCATFTLRDTGQKVALAEGGADNSAECW